MIACKTHIAIGHAAQDTSKGHGALTDEAQMAAAKEAYGWTTGPFEVPDDIKSAWEAIGSRGASDHADWKARFAEVSERRQAEFTRIFAGDAPAKLSARIKALKKQISEEKPKVATRKSSEMVLEVVNPIMPETVGGSADLTGSNNTKTGDLGVFDTDNRKGRYIYWGIREHGMAAAMNGMALHGGIRPYGGTFMCFTDYARPAMRLAALMKVPTVFVMTHDSIGLGEDGPTHQPVEHLAISRATPNTMVFRPCDTVETAEAWELALSSKIDAIGAVPDPSGPGDAAARTQEQEHDRTGRLRAGRGRRQASGDPDRHRLRGRNRHEGARHIAGRWHRHPRRLDALHGAFC